MKIAVENVLKVLDIYFEEVSEETRDFLLDKHVAYKDEIGDLHEDLVHIIEAVDSEFRPDGLKDPEKLEEELKALQALLFEHEAGYVRFVKM